MQKYKIGDISIGMKETFTRTVTEEMMRKFFDITGDGNPLHMDPDYAESKGYSDRVVYGMLTASLVSTLGGMYLPGKYCLIQGIDVKFAKPVFIGDVLTITGEVSRVDIDLKYLEIKVSIQNQDNAKVLRGIMKASVMDE